MVDETSTDEQEKKVVISVDGKDREIVPGLYSVPAFKAALGIDPSKVIEMMVDGVFKTLTEGSSIEVKAGEVFTSHVPRGGSSWK